MTEELTQDRLKEVLHYDSETGVFTWTSRVGSKVVVGAEAGTTKTENGLTYVGIGLDYKMYKAHRLVWLYVNGSWPEGGLDHIDGDGANNRIENLRPCNQTQNMQNVRAHKGSASGLLGVSWESRTKKWRAQIKAGDYHKRLGRFDDKIQAHQAYLVAKAQLHGFQPTPRVH